MSEDFFGCHRGGATGISQREAEMQLNKRTAPTAKNDPVQKVHGAALGEMLL